AASGAGTAAAAGAVTVPVMAAGASVAGAAPTSATVGGGSGASGIGTAASNAAGVSGAAWLMPAEAAKIRASAVPARTRSQRRARIGLSPKALADTPNRGSVDLNPPTPRSSDLTSIRGTTQQGAGAKGAILASLSPCY